MGFDGIKNETVHIEMALCKHTHTQSMLEWKENTTECQSLFHCSPTNEFRQYSTVQCSTAIRMPYNAVGNAIQIIRNAFNVRSVYLSPDTLQIYRSHRNYNHKHERNMDASVNAAGCCFIVIVMTVIVAAVAVIALKFLSFFLNCRLWIREPYTHTDRQSRHTESSIANGHSQKKWDKNKIKN